jgi:hypothetical protein
LARLRLAGDLHPVRVPGHEEEALRDLVRARDAVRVDLMRCRHRLSKLLLRRGIRFDDGRAWTDATVGELGKEGIRVPASVLPEQLGTAAEKVLVDTDFRASQAVEAGMQRWPQAGFSGHIAAKAAFPTSRVGVAIAASWAQATGVRWRPS